MIKDWVLLDVETTGLSAPIYVLEASVQVMNDWSPVGDPLSRLFNHDIEIPEASTRIHGYNRDILERDGLPPAEAWEALREVVGDRPVVSYNLPYDWDEVLAPEWQRLGIAPIDRRGFCALRLTCRLLDPVPAGNCKLQTIRRYYGLPEQAAHSAEGDVLTLADLFQQVLRPVAQKRDLDDWEDLTAYAEEEWYPSRIAFGKHKGRDFREAREDDDLRSYLEWLAASENERSGRLGAWYIQHLDDQPVPTGFIDFAETTSSPEDSVHVAPGAEDLVVWTDPEAGRLKLLVASSRARLGELQTEYGILRAKVDATRAHIFEVLRSLYEKRDALELRIQYRRRFLDVLLRGGEEEAETVEEEFRHAEEGQRRGYQETAHSLTDKKELTEEEQERLAKIWKKLANIYHPDRHQKDSEKRERYGKLMAMINRAKEEGDLKTLEEIAADPEAYARRQGLGDLDLSDRDESESLRRLWQALQDEILSVIESVEALKESSEYELAVLSEKDDSYLDRIVSNQAEELGEEIDKLSAEADKLGREIAELTGESHFD